MDKNINSNYNINNNLANTNIQHNNKKPLLNNIIKSISYI